MDDEKLKINVEIWKTIIDTQKHFNDLEMKIRNFSILMLSAFISAIGLSFKSAFVVTLFDLNFSIAFIFSLAAIIVWCLFYFMDVFWYHPLLKGAVKQGIKIENEIKQYLPGIVLTNEIGASSPKKFFFKKIHSTTKAHIFYRGVLLVLFFLAWGTFVSGSPDLEFDQNSYNINLNVSDSFPFLLLRASG